MKICTKCKKRKATIKIQNANLCNQCFIRYFEKKVFDTIKKFKLIDRNDKICVAVSGGKDSQATLHLLNKFVKKAKSKNLEIFAITIDEGIKGYKEKFIEYTRNLCKKEKIKLYEFSFKNEFGYTLDEIIKILKNKNPCHICGILRRYLINKYSRKLGATKLATGHNMDDEVQNILMNLFKGNLNLLARLGPKTGVVNHEGFTQRIKPLYPMSDEEVKTYVKLKKFNVSFEKCPNIKTSFRARVREMINSFELKYKGTKNGIINSFLEMLPLLKQKYENIGKPRKCKICGEPSTTEICATCRILDEIKENN